MEIRLIQKADNVALAKVIRKILTEFGIDKPGTVFTDPTTDALYELFQEKNSFYYVIDNEGTITGGCGVFPTKGLPEGCVELVKLYLDDSLRGLGLGKGLMEKCIIEAKKLGYTSMYLETLPELGQAVQLYEKLGFEKLPHALGDSGHHACTIWMIKYFND